MPEEPTPEELAALEADDAYLDALGSGLDVPGEPLNGLRAGDAGYVDWGRFPSAAIARGEVPRATRGGTLGTTQENAAIIRSQTQKVGEAVAALAHAMDLLADARNAALGAMGQTTAADTLGAIVSGTLNALEDAQGQVMSLNAAFDTAAAAGA